MGTQLFDEVVGELPPSTVNVNAIVRREKRRGAARRATGVATAVVAVAVTAGLGLLMGGGPGTSSPPPAPQAERSGTPAAPDTRFALVSDSAETAAATAKRLRTALDGAVRKEAAGATWLNGAPPKISFKTTKPEGVDIFAGDDTIAYDGRKGRLALGISIARPLADGPDAGKTFDPFACPSDAKCVQGKAPSGARTLVMTGDGWVDARVALSGKRWLDLSASNEIGPDGAGPAQAAPVLTGDQALAVATNLASQIKS